MDKPKGIFNISPAVEEAAGARPPHVSGNKCRQSLTSRQEDDNLMKRLTTFLLTFFIFGLTNAQTVLTYSDSLHSFRVLVDSSLSGDKVNFECSTKTISVYSKDGKKLLQTIISPDNSFFCSLPKEQIFLLEDINFDGLTDFMIVQFIPAAPNIPYYYWTFNNKTQQFQRDTTLEEITSPNFDKQQKVITSFWRASCCDHGLSIYKYVDGKITLIEENEIADDLDNPGQQITTKKKLINGEMKLIERTVEKVGQEK